MSTWQERVIEEKGALQVKLLALVEYLHTQPEIEPIQLALLEVQLSAMTTYRDVLTQRIAAM
jgi:hypothetical protein